MGSIALLKFAVLWKAELVGFDVNSAYHDAGQAEQHAQQAEMYMHLLLEANAGRGAQHAAAASHT